MAHSGELAPATPRLRPGSASSGASASGTTAPISLPFRRMSMPVVPLKSSFLSTDSIPEDPFASSSPPTSDKLKPTSPKRASRVSRPPSLASPRRLSARDSFTEINTTSLAKRWKIVAELCDSENTYLSGLDLIYSHFLLPLIESLESKASILSRSELNSIFSNFIDIWNFHRSFFSSLQAVANQPLSFRLTTPPHIAHILRSHFPYLSLYTPFVRSFPTTLAALNGLRASNERFAAYLKDKEQDQACQKLGLQAWLLTIIQRCPRYLLLLKDLVGNTPQMEKEHDELLEVISLVSKITLSIDTSLHTHSQVLSLLALQKSVPGLPIPLVAPGRTLLKRGRLVLLDKEKKLREVFLFSDCILWLVPPNTELPQPSQPAPQSSTRPRLGLRTRSRSDASLPRLSLQSTKSSPSLSSGKEYAFDRHFNLIDTEVVIGPSHPKVQEFGFDILSPDGSFSLFCADGTSLEDWVSSIRAAKASLLIGLSSIQMNTTLTSSSSNAHVRRALRALPYASEADPGSVRRGKVEHFLPPVWVPDQRTQHCMRCSKAFTWRRRRHHCRLCGRCVCAACSAKTFFIAEATGKERSKAARACNLCYDTVFPKLESDEPDASELGPGPEGLEQAGENIPIWRTTKATHLAVSVLELLGQSATEEYENEGRANPFSQTRSEHAVGEPSAHKRLSTPVLALQDTAALAHSRGSTRPRTLSLTGSSASLENLSGHARGSDSSGNYRSVVAEQLHQLLQSKDKE